MKLLTLLALFASSLVATAEDWQSLFKTGDDLKLWKCAESPESVRINEAGNILINGKRGHLFYMGEDGKASWKNFEAEIQFKTSESSNSGLFFHTAWQETNWPAQGYECQINCSHSDWRKTGSIYSFKDIKDSGHKDGEWVTMVLKVEGNKATVTVNGKVTNEYTQPEDHKPATKRFGEGTFALQAHDPVSVVEVRSLKVRRLP